MATKKSFFGRDSEEKKGNPFLADNPLLGRGGGATAPGTGRPRQAHEPPSPSERRAERRTNRNENRADARSRRRGNRADQRQEIIDERLGEYDDAGSGNYYDPQGEMGYGWREFLLEQNPETAYNWFRTNRVGLRDSGDETDPFNQFLEDEYDNIYGDYGQALVDRPNLKWQEFLSANLASGDLSARGLRNEFFSRDPRSRGASGGPATARWVPWN